jgi:multidrug efflux pump subunit AcrB
MVARAPGVATGTALHRMEELVRQVLPKGIGFEWADLALQQQQRGNALAHAAKSGRRVVSAFIATAFAQHDAEAARMQWHKVS